MVAPVSAATIVGVRMRRARVAAPRRAHRQAPAAQPALRCPADGQAGTRPGRAGAATARRRGPTGVRRSSTTPARRRRRRRSTPAICPSTTVSTTSLRADPGPGRTTCSCRARAPRCRPRSSVTTWPSKSSTPRSGAAAARPRVEDAEVDDDAALAGHGRRPRQARWGRTRRQRGPAATKAAAAAGPPRAPGPRRTPRRRRSSSPARMLESQPMGHARATHMPPARTACTVGAPRMPARASAGSMAGRRRA